VESPSLEIFQPRLATVLCSLLWVTLLGQGVGLGDPQRSLPTPTMLAFCDTAYAGCSASERGLGSQKMDFTVPTASLRSLHEYG